MQIPSSSHEVEYFCNHTEQEQEELTKVALNMQSPDYSHIIRTQLRDYIAILPSCCAS